MRDLPVQISRKLDEMRNHRVGGISVVVPLELPGGWERGSEVVKITTALLLPDIHFSAID